MQVWFTTSGWGGGVGQECSLKKVAIVPSPSSTHSSETLAGPQPRASANGLQLLVDAQVVGTLASFPLVKEAVYNSIHVYLLHEQPRTATGPRVFPPPLPRPASTKWWQAYVEGSTQRGSVHLSAAARWWAKRRGGKREGTAFMEAADCRLLFLGGVRVEVIASVAFTLAGSQVWFTPHALTPISHLLPLQIEIFLWSLTYICWWKWHIAA